MENDKIFKSLLSKIKSNYNLNDPKTFVLYNWYANQLILLNEFLDTNNEITNNKDRVQLLYILYNNQNKEKTKVKKLKEKHNYFRKTLKKKIDS